MKPTYAWTGTTTKEPAICDASLLEAAQAGDRAAISHLLAAHQRALYGLCRGILGQAEDAADGALLGRRWVQMDRTDYDYNVTIPAGWFDPGAVEQAAKTFFATAPQ